MIHVDHARIRRDLADRLVGVAGGGQAAADVDELPDALLGHPDRGPAVESPVGPRGVLHLGDGREYLLSGSLIGREVAVSAEHEVIDTGRCRPAAVYLGGAMMSGGHRALP